MHSTADHHRHQKISRTILDYIAEQSGKDYHAHLFQNLTTQTASPQAPRLGQAWGRLTRPACR